MKLEELIKVFVFCIICLILLPISAGSPGAVWAVDADGDKDSTFNFGELVHIRGSGLKPDCVFNWKITIPAEYKLVVKEGWGTTNNDGEIVLFSSEFYIPLEGPPKDYRLEIYIDSEIKVDAMSIKRDSFESIPEFPTIALPVAMILGLMFIFASRKEE